MARRILVVEDEAPIREMVCFVLEQNGFQPVEAEDYDTAVSKLNEPWPDLILLDWMLPGGSGLQFIKHIKREALTRDIPVVMLTARGEEEDRVRGLAGHRDGRVHVEGDAEILEAHLRRLGLVIRFLAEIVGRKAGDLEPLVLVALVDGLELAELAGEAAMAGGVDDQHRMSGVALGELDDLVGVQPAQRVVEQGLGLGGGFGGGFGECAGRGEGESGEREGEKRVAQALTQHGPVSVRKGERRGAGAPIGSTGLMTARRGASSQFEPAPSHSVSGVVGSGLGFVP